MALAVPKLAALLIVVLLTACTTPAILDPGKAPPCGWHPTDCGDGTCCPEHNACSTTRAGAKVCAFEGDDSIRYDAGSTE